MRKIRKLFILVIASLCVVSLAACKKDKEDADFISIDEVVAHAKTLSYSSDGSSSSITVTGTCNYTVPSTGYDGSEVTIKFYHTMGSNLSTVLETYIAKFNEIYPNIHIDHSQVGSYDDVKSQISTELTTGSEPNIAYCYPDHVALYNLTGKVVTLDNLIASQISDGNGGIIGLTQAQKDDFIEAYYQEGQQFGDGLMYTMPFSKSTEVLYYNETFFTAHNLDVPTHWFSESENDTTSMEYVCAKIKEIDPTSIPLGYDSESNWFITLAEQAGADYTSATGDHYLFDNDTMKSLMLRLRTWFQNGWITTSTLYGTYTSGLFVETDEGETKSYMSIGSSAGATHQRPSQVTNEDTGDTEYPFNVGITSIPYISSTYQRVISQGPSVCIFNKTNTQEVVASWLFVKYLTTSTEFQAAFSAASGYVPVLKSVSENATYKRNLAKADGGDYISYLAAKVCLEQADYYYTSPAFNGSSTARDQVGEMLASIISSTTDTPNKFINEAFQDAIDECEYQG